MKKLFSFLFLTTVIFSTNAFANTAVNLESETASRQTVYYVSSELGQNNNDGLSPLTPFKNIQKAINVAKEGSLIKIAQGNYFGLMNAGNIIMKTSVSLEGGYSSDFAQRDFLAYQTKIQPDNKSNKSGGNHPLLRIDVAQGNIVIDGLLFDKGESNNYHLKDGLVEGLGGLLLHPPSKTANSSIQNAKMPLISGPSAGSYKGDLTIKNCLFLNGNNMGINIQSDGKTKIENCVFVNNALFAIEMRGGSPTKRGHLEFANNTVMFTWPRTKEMSDMGYAFRARSYMDYSIHNNLFAFNWIGVDTTHDEKGREILLDNNMFLYNKKGDLLMTYEGNLFPVPVESFGDIEITSASGNINPTDINIITNVVHHDYAANFLAASYKEEIEHDPNSPINQLRQALGENQVGIMSAVATMYANKYPYSDALKLFGAVPDFGAQLSSQK